MSFPPPRPAKRRFARDEAVVAEVDVTNTGARRGDEVVQLYITRSQLGLARPVRELKGFARVTLDPGESRSITFTMPPSELAVWDDTLKETNPPGPLRLWAGNSSASLSFTDVEII